MNMEIELENCEKSLTLKDFKEIESKLGYILPERLKEFYLQYNGGSTKQTASINKYQEVEINMFLPFKYNKVFKNDPFHTVEGQTLEHRNFDSIYESIMFFAIGRNNLKNIGRIAVNISNGSAYFYKIIGFATKGRTFIFDEPQLIADSIADFFDNLVAFPKIDEIEEVQMETEGVMPELSDCSVQLTKEDIKDFEVELNVKIPASMKNYYLKFNGGMPSPYCFQPQDEDLDWVEIKAFFPIKKRTDAFEKIEAIAKDIWSKNLMPCNLLPFAMDSGGNYYALNLKNKKIYYYLTDEWDENVSREYNFETNTRYIAQSFNYFINHFIEEDE
ncbi:SMI1/KNR4 family protein [Bacteroides acidifaciens]|uniref:SMI1/KNR4 family protein n=1 Tax=Bacteroides acidifaciens TaxID=85831 RepID=UPI003014E702